MVCRSSGVLASIRSTSGRKPRSSISSASSSTSTLMWLRSSAPRSARSSSRPGVPTTTSTPRAQGVQLVVVADAAVDGQHPGVAPGRRGGDVGADLAGQLAGRGDHQALRGAGLGQLGVVPLAGYDDPLQQGDAEGQGLAGAGAGLADHVGAGQGDRDGHRLDRERGARCRPGPAPRRSRAARPGRRRSAAGRLGGRGLRRCQRLVVAGSSSVIGSVTRVSGSVSPAGRVERVAVRISPRRSRRAVTAARRTRGTPRRRGDADSLRCGCVPVARRFDASQRRPRH